MTKQNNPKQSRNVVPYLLLCGFLIQGCGKAAQNAATNAAGASNQMCNVPTDEPAYFEEVSTAASLPANEEEAHARRSRYVKADVASLRKSLLSGRRTLRLNLFDDTAVTVAVDKIERQADDTLVMTGQILGKELSSVSLVVGKDVVQANLHQGVGGTRYAIEYKANGTHSIQEVDTADDADDCLTAETPAEDPNNSATSTGGTGIEDAQNAIANDTGAEGDGTNTATATGTPTVDMLVAYTPNARASAGGTAAMKAKIAMGIADTNKAFQSSGVRLQVRLVGTMETRQNDTGNFSGDLNRLRAQGDGWYDEVHAERARLGADQVTLVGVYPGQTVAGIGFIKANAASAFTVVKLSAFNIYTFTHELGHNVGLQHSDGYVSSRFRTIMAYGSVPRILRFSNPGLTYNSYRTGDSAHNSASKLNMWGGSTSVLVASKLSSSSLNSMAAATTSAEVPLKAASADVAGMCSQAASGQAQ